MITCINIRKRNIFRSVTVNTDQLCPCHPNLARVKVNQNGRYLGHSEVIWFKSYCPDIEIRTGPIDRPGPLKRSEKNNEKELKIKVDLYLRLAQKLRSGSSVRNRQPVMERICVKQA